MYSETVSLRDVLSIIRNSRKQLISSVNPEYLENSPEDYLRHTDRDLQGRLGMAIAKNIEPSWYDISKDSWGYPQRSIETWVLKREQHDAIVMVLMKLAEHMKTFSVMLPVYGDQDVTPFVPKGR